MPELTERLFNLCQPAVLALGYELVDVEWVPAQGGRRLRVYVARAGEGKIGFDDCDHVAVALETVLDAVSELTEYTLEVSSPGLDRVIKRSTEYDIFKRRRVAVFLAEPIAARREHEGTLLGRVEHHVLLASDTGETLLIPMEHIRKCRLVFKVK